MSAAEHVLVRCRRMCGLMLCCVAACRTTTACSCSRQVVQQCLSQQEACTIKVCGVESSRSVQGRLDCVPCPARASHQHHCMAAAFVASGHNPHYSSKRFVHAMQCMCHSGD